MSTRVAERLDDWDSRSFTGGYHELHDLADEEFSGVIRADGAELYMTSGTAVGVKRGSIEDFEGASGTRYEAPSPALPLLAVMQERDVEVRAQYYSEDTPMEEVDRTLSDGAFTGYIELSENVLSGDYYLVYHGGRSMAVAFVGNSSKLITDDEAFETANDEVGIYKVRQVDVEPIEIPEPSGEAPSGGASETASGDAAGGTAGGAASGGGTEAGSTAGDGAASGTDAGTGATGGSAADSSSGDGTATREETPASEGTASSGESAATSGGSTAATQEAAEAEDRAGEPESRAGEAEDRAEDSADRSSSAEERSTASSAASSTRSAESQPTDADTAPNEASRSETGASSTASQDSKASTRKGAQPGQEGDSQPGSGGGRQEPGGGSQRQQSPSSSSDRDGGGRPSEQTTQRTADASSTSAPGNAGNRNQAGAGAPAGQGGGRGTQATGSAGGAAAGRGTPAGGGGAADLETRAIPSLDPGRTETPKRSTGQSGSGAGSRSQPQGAGGASGGATQRSGAGGTANQGAQPDRQRAPGGQRRDERGQRPQQEAGEGQQAPAGSDPGAGQRDAEVASEAGSGDEAGAGEPEPTGVPQEQFDDLQADLEEAEAEVERLETELGRVTTERDDLQEQLEAARQERDDLAEQVDRLESELQSLEEELGAATDAERRITAREALDGTDIFVRYHSKGDATLQKAHDGSVRRDDVTGNLRLEKHTQFDANSVSVGGKTYHEFLEARPEYQFIRWTVQELLFEIRDTGHAEALQVLYDALPQVDRAELNGVIEVTFSDDGQETRTQESFDVVLRDRMGNPLLVANLNDSRQGATESMMTDLITAAERVGQSSDTFAGAFLVTRSFFEPDALETAEEATRSGFLSRDKRRSFVNISRKQGFHLCLVEARNQNFHLAVPEL